MCGRKLYYIYIFFFFLLLLLLLLLPVVCAFFSLMLLFLGIYLRKKEDRWRKKKIGDVLSFIYLFVVVECVRFQSFFFLPSSLIDDVFFSCSSSHFIVGCLL